jgi:hypothetical protein
MHLKKSMYIWLGIAALYLSAVTYIKMGEAQVGEVLVGLVSSVVCIYVFRAFILNKTISLSIYDLKYPEHQIIRGLWFAVAVLWLLAYPFLNI